MNCLPTPDMYHMLYKLYVASIHLLVQLALAKGIISKLRHALLCQLYNVIITKGGKFEQSCINYRKEIMMPKQLFPSPDACMHNNNSLTLTCFLASYTMLLSALLRSNLHVDTHPLHNHKIMCNMCKNQQVLQYTHT